MAEYEPLTIRVRSPGWIRGLLSKIRLRSQRLSVRDGDILEEALLGHLERVEKETGPVGPAPINSG